MQVFGSSPDETAFFRILLSRERAGEAMLMIQPSLVSYSVENSTEPNPVLLDVQSVLPDKILMLDSYFTVVVWHGTTVADWRKAGYQEQADFASFKEMLEVGLGCTP